MKAANLSRYCPAAVEERLRARCGAEPRGSHV
jgi:hypothetical protein